MFESIKNQKFEDYELIIVGNSILQENFSKIISSIKIIFNNFDISIKYIYTEKKGANYSRMLGYQNAQGEYVFFMDADDQLVHDQVLCNTSLIIEKYNPDIISSNIQRAQIKDDVLIVTEKVHNFKNPNKLLIFEKNYKSITRDFSTNICARFIKKDLLIGINFLDLPFYQDWNVSSKVFLKAKTFYFVSEPAYYWLFRANSISKINTMTLNKHLESFNSILDVIQFYKKNIISSKHHYFLNARIIEFCFQYIGRSSIFNIEEGLNRSSLLVKKEIKLNLEFLKNRRMILLFLFIKVQPLMRLYLKFKPLK
jgi:glycosyltransferase involved in cell wall biosynthesis